MTSTIYLYGPPGVGKSTTGKFLAAKLNLPFVDLDGAIERSAGLSIPDIFEKEGEAGFRERESIALKSPRKASIVALGGGALLDRANRNHAEKIGEVICLQASSKTLADRLQRGKDQRPLLQGNSLKELLDTRSDHYHSVAIQVDTDKLTPEESAEVIQNRLGRFYLRGMGKGYAARVENNGLKYLDALLIENGCNPPFFIISDSNTAPLYAEALARKLDAKIVIFPAGEKNKTIDTMTRLWGDLLNAGIERRGTILAIGGGIVNDMAGFAAATIMRGVAWVSMPTSLLSMVDASLGGKTGANLPEGKNLVGAFYPPKLVLADPATLRTLPEAEIRNGLAEVVKHGVIDDPELFSLCGQGLEKLSENWHQLITRAMGVKIRIIEADPFEGGIRAALNFGHTIGHGIESLTQYGLRHGEAVGIGIVVEARLAETLGIAEAGLADKIAATLVTLGLPVAIPNGIRPSALVAAIQTDKKKSKGVVKFALPVKIGEMRVGVEIKDLERLLEEI